MKKVLAVLATCALTLTLSACGSSEKEKLYILNWGEYMDMDVVDAFEEEYNCEVIYDEVSSNEEMYTKISAGTTSYDLMFPSEYMIDKMIQEDLLYPIDKEIFTASDEYFPKVLEILNEVDPGNKYAVPYTWGTVGIMYNKDVEAQVKEHGFGVFFEPVEGIKNVGMYDGSRDSIAVALLYNNYDVNTKDLDELKAAEDSLNGFKYKMFADDALKTNVVSGNLDVAVVYSGDYLTQIYSDLEDGATEEDINYGYFVPQNTNLWVDGIVIPKTSQNQKLANEFIQFISSPENNMAISMYIGYCPTMPEVVDMIKEVEETKFITHADNYIPYQEGMTGQVYKYGGPEHYQKLDDIFTRIKAKY